MDINSAAEQNVIEEKATPTIAYDFFKPTTPFLLLRPTPTPTPTPLINIEVLADKIETPVKKEAIKKTPVAQTSGGIFGLNKEVTDLINYWSTFYNYATPNKAAAIVSCEGGNSPTVCNKQYGCSSGQGHFQFITSTWNNTCVKTLGLTNVYDSSQNLQCGVYILKNFGDSAWGNQETWWGSYRCWSAKYYK